MVYPRTYQPLARYLEPNRALVIYGPRRVGKTTLLQNFLSQTQAKYKLDSGDNIKVQHILSSQDFDQIIPYVQGYDIYAIDEAQRVPNIGLGLKIIVDQVPNIKVIATGSSSFSLSGQIGEPLTGRKNTLTLYPLSQIELSQIHNQFELKQNLHQILIYGSYPSVLSSPSDKQISELEEIVNSYLLKDILELERVKGSKILLDLLRLIAYQVGGEVSLSELGRQLGIDTKTVGRYLDLFEKSFIIFNLRGYSRNLRNEITNKSKYYFLDNGVRNAVISNFNSLETRNDIGQLWENFLVGERLKAQHYKSIHSNNYFWRTWDKQEIDWIEERGGELFASEFKYSSKSKYKPPKMFINAYPESSSQIVTPDNFLDFVNP